MYHVKLLLKYTVKEQIFYEESILQVDADSFDAAYPKAEKSNTAGITVEKRLYRINPNTFELDEITADDATYKVGLFLDKDGTIPYGDDYIRTIHIQNAQSGKASYSNVLRGTYYVFELDENNKAIKLNDEVQIDKENSFIRI